ncbi:response regulator [Tranquillimonas alkanivorans]|uniref:Response regulator receiver domain-containing protein n=1 Tax=Tranquillimonas alkanivorans TaxID=441119 RepID=A0A1I5Q8T8_9RHOB|nr:response regulator [Tranquillimonas alkanivorans]SFP42470.1 Response regulator receiver domain-containing protein [Tranquillimonas alkanivorans]
MTQLKRILHIDDDDDIREIVGIALRDVGGFELAQGSAGKDAAGIARDFRPDLVILDMMMPHMDGRATLEALRAEPGLEDVPAIFMTAKTGGEIDGVAADSGAIAVITKPFDVMTLCDEVQDAWSRCGEARRAG